jgi:hypothetical protein
MFVGVAVVLFGAMSTPALLQEKGGDNRTGPYDVVEKWPLPSRLAKPGHIFGSTAGIFAESADKVFVSVRGEIKLPEVVNGRKVPPNFTGAFGALGLQATSQVPDMRNCILTIDASGNIVDSWTQWDKLFQDGRGPHQILISPYDPERHVWVVDDMRHQVHKFTNDGTKLVFSLGESGIFGDNEDPEHFRRPTDVAFLPDGTFFVSDGYGNHRVLKFDKNGKFVKKWGTAGTGPSQFETPHAIATDKKRRVYVADRSNNRIQIFDEDGKFLDMWTDISSPYTIRISDDDRYAWISSGTLNEFLQYDLNGKLLYNWGTYGTRPGQMWSVHQFSSDPDGNLYTAEVFGGRAQKFKPKPGADRSKMFIQQALMPKPSGTRSQQ